MCYQIIWREYRDDPWTVEDVTNDPAAIDTLIYNCRVRHPMAVVQVRAVVGG